MADLLRSVEPINETPTKRLKRQPIPPPPKIAWLPLSQLVIDGAYQRGLSDKSVTLIRKLVETWDWNSFKPLSVAPVGDAKYEIIDGQHTAIAAATHGAIETLPCLVLSAETAAQRATAFVGINFDRIALTPYAVYRARVVSGDPEALAVEQALQQAAATLVERTQPGVEYPVGTCAIVSTLLQIVRRGGRPRLARLLRMAVAAEVAPIPSALLKGLEVLTSTKGAAPADDAIVAALASADLDTLNEEVRAYRRVCGAHSAEAWAHILSVRATGRREAA